MKNEKKGALWYILWITYKQKMNDTKDNFIVKLDKIMNSKDNMDNVEKFNQYLSSADIFIYGAGNAGRMTYQLLKEKNINISGFIDRRAKEIQTYMGKAVYETDSITNKVESFIIISFICSHNELTEIKNELYECGFKRICYYFDVYSYYFSIQSQYKNMNTESNEFSNQQEKIATVGSCLCDDRSREVYYNFFNAIMNSNSELFSLPDTETQYFVNDITFNKGYSRFIDCGAFDGDTAIMLKKCKGIVERIVFFEPDSINFEKLTKNLDNHSLADEIVLFPCGVWNKTEMLKFKAGIQSSSGISEDGNVYVQCVALDDVLKNFKPTFIKMDIEGAEYEALLGAEKTIQEYKPDLAISIYHQIDHMWKIPLLIKKFNPDYAFYIRSHDILGMETILYAVNKD